MTVGGLGFFSEARNRREGRPSEGAMPSERAFRVLDPEYPAVLRELPHPPDPVWVRGELPEGPAVAIVGTRSASPAALDFARKLARFLAEAGVVVFSGGAAGIDRAAHEGALDAGAPTVVVAGTGLDHVYPKEHETLFETIVERGGAILSPFERHQRGWKWTFLRRNSVLAALTRALILIEAPIKSGARSAAMAARRLGRPVFAVPGAPWDPLGAGAFVEMRAGALPFINEADLFDAVGLAPPTEGEPLFPWALALPSKPSRSRAASTDVVTEVVSPPAEPSGSLALPADLPPAVRAVWEATSAAPRHADELCAMTGLSAAVVHEALLTLTLHAVLVEAPSGCFRRISG